MALAQAVWTLLSPADAALIVCVAAISVSLAYVHSPVAKSIIYMVPVPFSLALFTTGCGVDVTHVVGLGCAWAFSWIVLLVHRRLGVNIILAELLAIVIHVNVGLATVRLVPSSGPAGAWAYRAACAGLLAVGLLALRLPHRAEPGHRSPMPPAVKIPLVLLLVTGLILARRPLHGFMPTFPMVTTFAVYEARHSLYTLARRMAICVVGFIPMIVVIRFLLPAEGPVAPGEYLLALAFGWAVYIPMYVFLNLADRKAGTQTA